MFDATFYANNRSALLSQVGKNSLITVAGHVPMQLSADLTYPFRQDSNMRYLAGVEEPNIVLVFSKDYSFLIVPDRSDFTSLWDGQSGLDEIKKSSGVDEVFETKAGWKQLRAILQHHEQIGLLEPIASLPGGGVVNPARQHLKKRLKTHTGPKHNFVDIRKSLSELRVVKQPCEIEAIQTASDITAAGYAAMMERMPSAKFEYELQAAFSAVFEARNSNHAYDPIIASGKRSCILHYTDNNQPITDNLVLFDVAAQHNGYHSDVSRTLSHKASLSKRAQAVYDAVLDVQLATIKAIKVGMSFVEVDTIMRRETAKALVGLGLSKTESIDDTKRYLPHSSHFIGLDVHDVGDYTAPLASDTVFTIEPGIYIPEEGIGVRIEDVIHLNNDGASVMTKAIPK